MNEFYYEVDNVFDLDQIRDIALPYITEDWKKVDDVTGLRDFSDRIVIPVIEHVYLSLLQERFPKLHPLCKILKNSERQWPVHVDVNRRVSINIPLANTGEGKFTQFYTGGEQVEWWKGYFGSLYDTWQSNQYHTYIANSEHAVDYVLHEKPAIINTTQPHSVFNQHADPVDPNPRFILAWGYHGTFEQAIEDFSQ